MTTTSSSISGSVERTLIYIGATVVIIPPLLGLAYLTKKVHDNAEDIKRLEKENILLKKNISDLQEDITVLSKNDEHFNLQVQMVLGHLAKIQHQVTTAVDKVQKKNPSLKTAKPAHSSLQITPQLTGYRRPVLAYPVVSPIKSKHEEDTVSVNQRSRQERLTDALLDGAMQQVGKKTADLVINNSSPMGMLTSACNYFFG